MDLMAVWIAIAVSALVMYLYTIYTKLSRRGVNHLPVIPIFGNLFYVFFKKQHMIDCLMNIIRAFPNDKIVGHYDMVNPVMIVQDIETIKRISIKDFEHFVDRRQLASKYDPLFGRGLTILTGDEWKAMRSTLSPAFTSSKIRLMVNFMEETGEEMIKVLKKKIQESGNEYVDMEIKDMVTRYANDVIASCAFGLKVNSQVENNLFYTMGQNVTSVHLLLVFKMFFIRLLPSVAQMLNINLVSREISDFFTNIFRDTMKYREENQINRNDLLNILIEVKKGQLKHEKDAVDDNAGFAVTKEWPTDKKQYNIKWTDGDLLAQAMLFLFAGFETISLTVTYLLHELAMNPDIQDQLVQEIREQDVKNGGKIDYDSINSMTYLDMVISETLRLWNPVALISRVCVKEYNIGRPNDKATKDLIIRKGEVLMIPIWALNRDPQFFPDPLKFDPERFSAKNRDKIKPFTYLPFGLGPRNCIGSRFALCEMKVLLYQLLREMEVSICEKTCVPLKLSEGGLSMNIRGGAWLRMRIRPNK